MSVPTLTALSAAQPRNMPPGLGPLWPSLAIGAALLALYLREKLRGRLLRAVFIKGALSAMFIAAAAAGSAVSAIVSGNSDGYALVFIINGLTFGLLGDIWLDLKYIFPERDAQFTRAGFICFGVGHVFYILGIVLTYMGMWHGTAANIIVPVLLAALISAVNIALEKPMKLRYGEMKPYVLIYGILLFSTVLISGSFAMVHRWEQVTLDMFFIGSVLFAASDLVLSGIYFSGKKAKPAQIAANYLLYYGGQFVIAASLFFYRDWIALPYD